jgi:hypothetical protein
MKLALKDNSSRPNSPAAAARGSARNTARPAITKRWSHATDPQRLPFPWPPLRARMQATRSQAARLTRAFLGLRRRARVAARDRLAPRAGRLQRSGRRRLPHRRPVRCAHRPRPAVVRVRERCGGRVGPPSAARARQQLGRGGAASASRRGPVRGARAHRARGRAAAEGRWRAVALAGREGCGRGRLALAGRGTRGSGRRGRGGGARAHGGSTCVAGRGGEVATYGAGGRADASPARGSSRAHLAAGGAGCGRCCARRSPRHHLQGEGQQRGGGCKQLPDPAPAAQPPLRRS